MKILMFNAGDYKSYSEALESGAVYSNNLPIEAVQSALDGLNTSELFELLETVATIQDCIDSKQKDIKTGVLISDKFIELADILSGDYQKQEKKNNFIAALMQILNASESYTDAAWFTLSDSAKNQCRTMHGAKQIALIYKNRFNLVS